MLILGFKLGSGIWDVDNESDYTSHTTAVQSFAHAPPWSPKPPRWYIAQRHPDPTKLRGGVRHYIHMSCRAVGLSIKDKDIDKDKDKDKDKDSV